MPIKKSAKKAAAKPATAKTLNAKAVAKKPQHQKQKKDLKPLAKMTTSSKKSEATTRTVTERLDPRAEATEQANAFDKAMRLFHARNFKEALQYYDRATGGPNRQMAHAAQLHQRMCQQRLAAEEPQPQTPEERYTYAVTLINARANLRAAEQQLRKAIEAQPEGDHLHYTLALCLGLQGDYSGAGAALARSIEIRPSNRSAARNDPDFREIQHYSPVRDLLLAEQA